MSQKKYKFITHAGGWNSCTKCFYVFSVSLFRRLSYWRENGIFCINHFSERDHVSCIIQTSNSTVLYAYKCNEALMNPSWAAPRIILLTNVMGDLNAYVSYTVTFAGRPLNKQCFISQVGTGLVPSQQPRRDGRLGLPMREIRTRNLESCSRHRRPVARFISDL